MISGKFMKKALLYFRKKWLFKLCFLNRVNLTPSAYMLLMLVFTVVFGFGFGIIVLKLKEFINEKNV